MPGSALAHQCNTTAVFACTPQRPEQQGLATQFFKHQYITNPTVSPESHVVTAAQQLATALQGNIQAGNKTAEALTVYLLSHSSGSKTRTFW
jgi:hypothetical protein